MEELLQEIEKDAQSGRRIFSLPSLLFLALLILLFGLHIGNLLFGVNGLDALLRLQNKEHLLNEKVLQLREENARLQKEYFELKELEPGS